MYKLSYLEHLSQFHTSIKNKKASIPLSCSLFDVLKMKLENFFQHAKENRSMSGHTILNNQSLIRSTPLSNMFQFQKIVRQAKRIFEHISIPICIIHGQKDEIVYPKSSELIYRVVSSKEKELHYLPRSKHHICQDCEIDTVIQMVIKFLEKYH